MKNLFSQIESELAHPDHQDGWCSVQKAFYLAASVMALRPNLVVEVGVWAGRSVIPAALSLKKLGRGKEICIDPWRPSDSSKGLPDGKDKEWWAKVDHERIFNVFKKWVTDAQVEPYVEIHRCRSDEFKIEKLGLIGILSVDGNHGEEASIYDITHYAPRVERGGFLFMDDIGWATKATSLIPQYGFKELYQLDTGKIYQRIDYGIKI